MHLPVNEASRWRFVLAQRIGSEYSGHSGVCAVLVGGSVARDCADQFSDVEIGVVWAEPPLEASRKTLCAAAGGASYKAYPCEDGEWTEEYQAFGVKIDVSHCLVSSMEAWLSDVVEHNDIDVRKQNLLDAIQHALPLSGHALWHQWKVKADAYPQGLAEAMIKENLMLGPHSWLEMLAERESVIELYQIASTVEKRLLGVLLGLNRVYHPGYKWLDRLVSSLTIAPPNLSVRLKQVFSLPPRDGVSELGRLVEETYALVEQNMEGIDLSAARQRFRQTRPVHDAAPESLYPPPLATPHLTD